MEGDEMAEYFRGDEIKLTGKIINEAGGEFEEFVYVEGHRAGQTGSRATKAELARQAERVKSERERMQAGFRRLHVKAGLLK
jgi:hypothetical protein